MNETAPEATAAEYSPDECPRMAEALEATGVAKSFCNRSASQQQSRPVKELGSSPPEYEGRRWR